MNTLLPKKRRIAVIGIGGIGGYFGTRLLLRYSSDPNYEFIFIQRGEHLKKIQESGLKYITQSHEYTVFPDIVTSESERAGLFDIALFCVKSYDLESIAALLRNNLNRNSVVIPTLNGIEIHKRLLKVLPATKILPGCIYISAQIERPGVVRQIGGAGQFYFGPVNGQTAGLLDIERIFKEARIKAHLDAGIVKRIWEKYIFVCPLASLTTLYNEPIGAVVEKKEKQELLLDLVDEIKQIAEHQGISLSPDLTQSILERIRLIPYHTATSMQVDAAAGRRIEMDTFTEYVVKKGRELGIPTPWHDDVYSKLLDKCL